MEIKSYIKNKLMTKDGRVNSAILRRDWFLLSTEYATMIENTKFLIEPNITERLYCILNDIKDNLICPICQTRYRVFLPHKSVGYSETCNDKKCIASNPNNNARRIATNLEKYGMKTSPLAISSAKSRVHLLQTKGRETIRKKYGVENVSQLPYVKEIVRHSNAARMNSPQYIAKIEENRIARFNNIENIKVLNVIKPSEYKLSSNINAVYYVEYECKICGHIDTLAHNTIVWRYRNFNTACTKCSGIINGSYLQNQVFNYIKNIKPDAEMNNKILLADHRLELDVYIPSLKLAFEIDGLFWHSFNYKENVSERNKHKNKTSLALDAGIRLIHIFENELKYKRHIVDSRIKCLLGTAIKIYARKCEIKEVSSKEEKIFLNNTHIQGYTPSKFRYGLYYNDKLSAIMTFGKSRFDKKYQYELLRYSSDLDTVVVGGASRLFNRFVQENTPSSIISYCDLRWGTGNLYTNLKFVKVSDTPPNYFYVKSDNLYNRIKFQKHKLKNILENYDEKMTEVENMFNNGFRRIWDCGNSKWEWKNEY